MTNEAGLEFNRVPDKWPVDNPDINPWYKDLSGFMALIQNSGAFWCINTRLKYLNFYTDTRSGHFLIKDREGKEVKAEEVLEAIKKWRVR